MSVEAVPTPSVTPLGPYSSAIRAGDWVVCAGQIGVDPATGMLVDGGIVAEARQALANVTAVLADCGCDWGDVAKVTLFATGEPSAMKAVNALYAEAIGERRPARSTVGVAWLPLGAAFEIEVWAHRPKAR
jgi:2-iminobutanoate/2-iminopropanoate deaminase